MSAPLPPLPTPPPLGGQPLQVSPARKKLIVLLAACILIPANVIFAIVMLSRRPPVQPPPSIAKLTPAPRAPVAPIEHALSPAPDCDLARAGALGFPQNEATVLWDTPNLRVSVWSNREYLYAQAVVWSDGDSTTGRTKDGKEIGDHSMLVLRLRDRAYSTPNVDRQYLLNPWPNLPGLHYTISHGGGTSGIKSDTTGRGTICYETIAPERSARVDSFLVPLAELAKQPGDKLWLSLRVDSPNPELTTVMATYSEVILQPGHDLDLSRLPVTKRPAATPRPPTAAPVGQALDVKFTALDGSKIDLAKLRGKVVLIDFWATWCGPCIAELPRVRDAYAKFHDRGFEILGISLDTDRAALDRVISEKSIPWPQYFDGKSTGNALGQRFGIRSIPTMWLVNKQGVLVSSNARTDLAGQVEKLLAE